jgi:hypothetical protein
VCVLERDMMIASCHGIREGSIVEKMDCVGTEKAGTSLLREMGVHLASVGCAPSLGRSTPNIGDPPSSAVRCAQASGYELPL